MGNNVLGIIFANVHDNLIPELAQQRSMASIPFGSRYRLIDFSLSNLVNAGVSKVGILTKENYRSLMDHLGSGKAWDLDRKNGGIYIMPPFNNAKYGFFKGHVDALAGIVTFLTRSCEEYVVMSDADVISNIDVDEMVQNHIKSDADITVAYKKGILPKNNGDIMRLSVDENGVINKVSFDSNENNETDYSLDIYVIKRELLIEWIKEANRRSANSLSKEVLMPRIKSGKICGYRVSGFAEIVDSADSYVEISKKLLIAENRRSLFNSQRPVYTKTRDDVPTRYGVSAKASNCLIADGCVIEGEVKNSILFRGVTVKKGAVVENCILMQGTVVNVDAHLSNVTADKGVDITAETTLKGSEEKNIFIPKKRVV